MSVRESDDALSREERKKKKKERKLNRDDATVRQLNSENHNTEAKKKKQKSRQNQTGGDIVIADTPEFEAAETTITTMEAAKKKKKRKHSEVVDGPAADHDLSIKKKQRDEDPSATRNNKTLSSTDDKGEKAKSEKKDKRIGDGDDDVSEKPKTKKEPKIKDVDLLDPAEDPALGEQASKALIYAYTQFADPPSWKFNKARQNWLIRNLWSDETIPDAHLPLLLRYLTGIKGGVRDALRRTCQEILQPPAESSTEAPPKKRVSFATDPEPAQEVSQDKEDSAQETTAVATASAKDAQKLALRTSRATQVLHCLTAA